MPENNYYGMLAVCSKGKLGLISSVGKQDVEYPDGNKGRAYTGIHLTDPIGAPWSSREPKVLGHLFDILRGKTKVQGF